MTRPVPLPLWLLPSIALALAILPMPYGYYSILRAAICLAGIVLAWLLLRQRGAHWLGWTFVLVALIYNPILAAHFDRRVWTVINLGSIVPFAIVGWAQHRKKL